MSGSKTFRNIIGVTISNVITILSGIVVGFVIPKILSVEGYGYYKAFTLYTTYLSLCHLGIIDGIVLCHGEKDYDGLNRNQFRSVFRWFLIVNVVFSIILTGFAIIFRESNYSFILFALGANVIAVNILGYFQYISQITQRFKEYSIRKIIQGILTIVIVMVLFVMMKKGLDKIDYMLYVGLVIFESYLLSIWYMVTYKDIVWGKADSLMNTKSEVVKYIKVGIPLLIANMCSTLILTIDRQFVNCFFDISTYAVYSFAYNMLSLVTVATSAISTVLYPTMKRSTKEKLLDRFDLLISVMLVFVFFALVAYFPLLYFVNWYLPKYTDSLQIFRIIFAGLPISSAITVVIHNYYKVFGLNTKYFVKSIAVLALSVLANVLAYIVFGTTYSISIASIFTMIIWFIYVEYYFVKEYRVPFKRNIIYALVLMILFYIITWYHNDYLGLVFYALGFVCVTFVFYKNSFKEMICLIKK